MCNLVRVSLNEGGACRGASNVCTARGVIRQPVKPIGEAQHIRHQDVSN
jgi:hypothetical protein